MEEAQEPTRLRHVNTSNIPIIDFRGPAKNQVSPLFECSIWPVMMMADRVNKMYPNDDVS